MSAAKVLRWWPDRAERWRILLLWRRRRHQPGRAPALPAAWRRQRRLVFWWTLAAWAQDQPGLALSCLAAWPAWLVLVLWRLAGN